MNIYNVTLGQTYFNKPIFNVGSAATLHLGNHNEIVKIILWDKGELTTNINRTSNKNGSVRLHLGNEWIAFIQAYFVQGDSLAFQVINNNTIQIIW